MSRFQYSTEPSRLHRCRICGRVAPWSRPWRWYGSYEILDAGRPIVKTCSAKCRTDAVKRGLIPSNAKEIDDE